MRLDINGSPSEIGGIIDPTRIVANRVYYDPAIYAAEVEKIFGRCWQLVCHESEVAQPGRYLTTRVADSPVVIVRGKDGKLRAFYNTCRHRGSRVVLDECGEAASLRCPYHFWVYSLEGELIGVPGEEAYAGSGFRKEDFPLVELRCDAVLGLVFVNPDPAAIPLEEWLGEEIIRTLQTPLGGARYVVTKRRRRELAVNWKIWAENARDGYHVPFVHPFFRKASPPGEYTLCANGHAVQRVGMDPAGMSPELWDAMQRERLPGLGPTDGYVMTLFPDGFLMVRSNFVSIDVQHRIDANHLVFEERLLGIEGETPDVTERRSVGQAAFLWDPLNEEDFPIFAAQQEGVMSRGVTESIIARGVDATTGLRGDDNRLRHFWLQWRKMMEAEYNG